MPLSPHLAVTYTAYATSFLAFISSNKQRKEEIRKIGSVLIILGNLFQNLKVACKPLLTSSYLHTACKLPIWHFRIDIKIKVLHSKNLILLTLEHFEVPAVKIFMKIYITFWISRIRIWQSVIRIFYLTSVYQQIRWNSILVLRIEPNYKFMFLRYYFLNVHHA